MMYTRSFCIRLLLLVLIGLSTFPSVGIARERLSVEEIMRERMDRLVSALEERVADMLARHCVRFEGYRERWGSRMPVFCIQEQEPKEPNDPSTNEGRLLLSEIFYDVDGAHGEEYTNEWVEIYNSADVARDLSGYVIADATGEDTLPEGAMIPAHGYLVITEGSSTEDFWDIPQDSTLLVLGERIAGNGLGNVGDALFLKDEEGTLLDEISWGNNTDVFDPSAPDAPEGSSLIRNDEEGDTDSASDWSVSTSPTPGNENI